LALAFACGLTLVLVQSCGAPKIDNPVAVLNEPGRPGRDYLAAMATGDRAPQDPQYRQALRRVVVSPNYVVEARRAAYSRLKEIDPAGLADTLEVHLPKMEALEWRRELCERIAEDQWREMTPTLIRAWAAPLAGWATLGKERPERLAIAAMYGEDKVVDVLLESMAKANPITQANLRARCWELVLLEGQEERLRALLADEAAIGRDAMLLDIRAGTVDLGVLPRTREEILWLRSLRTPENAAFWQEATAAATKLPAARRTNLELRDVPVLVAAARHQPDLLTMSDEEIASRVTAATGGDRRPIYSPDFEGYSGGFSERLSSVREKLTWGDLAALALAVDAMRVPELRAHLFETADRDRADTSTEYGGIIALDRSGRYDFIEFPSRSRANDKRYESPQELMDALYTSLFHVHLHAQSYDNRRYAGPHMGDFQFSDATRANCLVFSFIDADRLNVDYYRHGRTVVDLGTIERPSGRR
jgi:hypothetical protein